MVESDIKINKEGLWFYRGAHMFRKDILCIFFQNLNVDDSGHYFIKLNGEICYLDVEDTPFVVEAVSEVRDASGCLEEIVILTSDEEEEQLDLNSLTVGQDNIIYCRIKQGRFPARFTRKSYYQLAAFIEQEHEEGNFFIILKNKKFFIKIE